jgi:aminoglycoside phosphotransferase (APT) family kinase protein
VNRDYRIISGLWGTGIAVPEPLAYCADSSVTGSPFYVMTYVAGRVTPDAGGKRELLPTDALQRRAAEAFADLHDLLAETVHFQGSRRPEDFVARQLRAWYRSWTLSATDSGIDDPRATNCATCWSGPSPIRDLW